MKFKTNVKVRYQETDQMGIAHHSVYAVWYEIGRTEATADMGYDYRNIEERGLMMPLVKLSCNFKGTAKYNDELEIVTFVKELSCAKVVYGYEIYNGGVLINQGETILAFVDSKTFRPVNVKKCYPDIYETLLKNVEK